MTQPAQAAESPAMSQQGSTRAETPRLQFSGQDFFSTLGATPVDNPLFSPTLRAAEDTPPPGFRTADQVHRLDLQLLLFSHASMPMQAADVCDESDAHVHKPV